MLSCNDNTPDGFTPCPICAAYLDGGWDDVHVEDHYEACYHAMLRAHAHVQPTTEELKDAELEADDNAAARDDVVMGVDEDMDAGDSSAGISHDHTKQQPCPTAPTK